MSYKGKKPVKLILKVKLMQPSTTRRQELLSEYYTVSFEKTAIKEARNQNSSFLAYIWFVGKQNKTKS